MHRLELANCGDVEAVGGHFIKGTDYGVVNCDVKLGVNGLDKGEQFRLFICCGLQRDSVAMVMAF